jgi:hypothetical protein
VYGAQRDEFTVAPPPFSLAQPPTVGRSPLCQTTGAGFLSGQLIRCCAVGAPKDRIVGRLRRMSLTDGRWIARLMTDVVVWRRLFDAGAADEDDSDVDSADN